jgi:lipopolysaccharide export system protein LptC
MNEPTISTLDPLADHGFAASGRTDSAQAFRRALRHSRHVQLLRVAVPVTLVLAVVAVVLVSWLDPMRVLARLPVSVDRIAVSGTKITMAAPKLSGYTRDSRKYDLSARAAVQDVTQPDLLDLHDVAAKIEMQDKTVLDLTATDGHFDRKTSQLTLRRNVLLVTSTGYEVRMNQVRIDTGTGNVVSDEPIHIKMLQGDLNANRLEVFKSGEVVTFGGGVTLKLLMNEKAAPRGNPGNP